MNRPPNHRTERPGARDAAFEILLRVERAGAYASVLLDRREAAQPDRREAALLHELVLGVLRRRAVLDALIERASNRPARQIDPETRTALRIGTYGLFFLQRVPTFAAVNSAVDLVKTGRARAAVPFVNGVLRRLSREGADWLPPSPNRGQVEALALHHSHPVWWVRRLVEREGWDRACAVLERNNRPAPTVLRASLRRCSPSRLCEELAAEEIATEPARFVPEALHVISGPLKGCRALAEGRAWVQDEAAQLVASMVGEPVGPRVADLCAAPGGKSLLLADRLERGGFVAAVDRHEGRLRRLARNLARVGADRDVLPLRADLESAPLPLRGRFDQVLLDAPCSGSGTIGRRPEIRWRLREEALKLLASRQGRLLSAAAELVRGGGTLVYSVCSTEPEEGEEVVARFLHSRPDFRRADPRPALPAAARSLVDGAGQLRTSPADGALDGFFAALLTRKPAPGAAGGE